MEVSRLSKRYKVRQLNLSDINEVYDLCSQNTLYYEYCPPFVTLDAVKEDMEMLPPGKAQGDKYFLGYYDGEVLVAIMDLIRQYPNDKTLYIGLFMTNVQLQGNGVGTEIIRELSDFAKMNDYERLELAWVKGNPQAEHFWKKNGFVPIGERSSNAAEYVIAAEKRMI